MPGDMAVALGTSTVDGGTLFAHNSGHPVGGGGRLCLAPGREFAFGETVATQFLRLPQVRQSCAVLGTQPAGCWGYDHGVNDHSVAIGRTSHQSKLPSAEPGLTGPDLVRLALERARSAHQAVDLVTDFIERHGQGRFPGCPAPMCCDNTFLIADPSEAFIVEAAGRHWVCQQVQQLRAASDVSLVRQDWSRISRGLSTHAIEKGWWPEDGSKLDFAGSFADEPGAAGSALRRWERTMQLLAQQAGHIDVAFLRRVLGDHYETTPSELDPFGSASGPAPVCQHGHGPNAAYTAGSMVAALAGDPARLNPVWCAFGPPCIGVFFPIFLEADLPAGFGGDSEATVGSATRRLNDRLRRHPEELPALSEALARLQGRFDQEADEFVAEHAALKQTAPAELRHHATMFHQHHLEQFQAVVEGLLQTERRRAMVAPTV